MFEFLLASVSTFFELQMSYSISTSRLNTQLISFDGSYLTLNVAKIDDFIFSKNEIRSEISLKLSSSNSSIFLSNAFTVIISE